MASKGISVFTHQGEDYNITDQNNAPEFDSTVSYAAGEYCTYNGNLYRFRMPHSAGAWSSAHVEEAKIGGDIRTVKTDIETFNATGKYEKVFSILGGTANYIYSENITFPKGHDIYIEVENVDSNVLNGNACQNMLNYAQYGSLNNPLAGRRIGELPEDVTAVGYYIPGNAIGNSGRIKMTITDMGQVPYNQLRDVFGNFGNKISTTLSKGYSDDDGNSFTASETARTMNVSVTKVANKTIALVLPLTLATFRIGVRIKSSNIGQMVVMTTYASSNWTNGYWLDDRTPKAGEVFFVDVPASATSGKNFLMFRCGSTGTAIEFDYYLADMDKFNAFPAGVGELYALKAREAEVSGAEGLPYDCDIIFWGDSITAGAGATDQANCYVRKCCDMLNTSKFINAGVGGETIWTIAARQGGTTVMAPAQDLATAQFALTDENGNPVRPLVGGYLVGPDIVTRAITINGIDGQLARISSDVYKIENINTTLACPAPIKFPGSAYKSKITVLFAGTNNWSSSAPEADIPYLKDMISRIGNDHYIVIGIYKENSPEYDAAMASEFGSHFINMRNLLSQYGLAINGMTPTASDTAAMNAGLVPPSLLSDDIHPNDYGHLAIATILYNQILFLGYDKLIG